MIWVIDSTRFNNFFLFIKLFFYLTIQNQRSQNWAPTKYQGICLRLWWIIKKQIKINHIAQSKINKILKNQIKKKINNKNKKENKRHPSMGWQAFALGPLVYKKIKAMCC